MAEIKKVNAAMMAIKSEISKYEDTLKEYQMYRKFLDNLTPQVCISFFDTSGQVLNYEYFAYEFYPFPDILKRYQYSELKSKPEISLQIVD